MLRRDPAREAQIERAKRLVQGGATLGDASAATSISITTLKRRSAAEGWIVEREGKAGPALDLSVASLTAATLARIKTALHDEKTRPTDLIAISRYLEECEQREAAEVARGRDFSWLSLDMLRVAGAIAKRDHAIHTDPALAPVVADLVRRLAFVIERGPHDVDAAIKGGTAPFQAEIDQHEVLQDLERVRAQLDRAETERDQALDEVDRLRKEAAPAVAAELDRVRQDLALVRLERDAARQDAEGLRRVIESR
jgi:hypothetical protein